MPIKCIVHIAPPPSDTAAAMIQVIDGPAFDDFIPFVICKPVKYRNKEGKNYKKPVIASIHFHGKLPLDGSVEKRKIIVSLKSA